MYSNSNAISTILHLRFYINALIDHSAVSHKTTRFESSKSAIFVLDICLLNFSYTYVKYMNLKENTLEMKQDTDMYYV